jgi:phage/plasmid-like protein (TIGR03299 family)
VTADAPIEVWVNEAGFDFEILSGLVRYIDDVGSEHAMTNRQVLYRSDTKDAIAIHSNRYQVVQPADVVDFFRTVCDGFGYRMETMGVLGNGAKYWGLARTERSAEVTAGDRVDDYLLLATSCDGSMTTIGRPTSVRVVCNNTLDYSLYGDGADKDGKAISVPHSTRFDPDAVMEQLGLVDHDRSWQRFIETMRALQQTPIDEAVARDFFADLLAPPARRRRDLSATSFAELVDGDVRPAEAEAIKTDRDSRVVRRMLEAYAEAPGAAPGTAYGLVQAVTYDVDHTRGRTAATRWDASQFGVGLSMKHRALAGAVALAKRVA